MVTCTVRVDFHVCNFNIRLHIRLVQVFVLYIVCIITQGNVCVSLHVIATPALSNCAVDSGYQSLQHISII